MSIYLISKALQEERKIIFWINKQLSIKEVSCRWSRRQEDNIRAIIRGTREMIDNDLPNFGKLLTAYKIHPSQRPENAFAKLELSWNNILLEVNFLKENAREFLGSNAVLLSRPVKSVQRTRSNVSSLLHSFSHLEIRRPRPLTAHPPGSSRIGRPTTAGKVRGESTQKALENTCHSVPGSGCFKKANSACRRPAPAPAAAAGCSGTSKAQRSTAAIRSTRQQTSALPRTTNEKPKAETNKPPHSYLRRKSQRYVLKEKTSSYHSALGEPQDQRPFGRS